MPTPLADSYYEEFDLEIVGRIPLTEYLKDSLLCILVFHRRTLRAFKPADHILHRHPPNCVGPRTIAVWLTFELSWRPAVGAPLELGVRRRLCCDVHEGHCPAGGCQSSTLLPSGSMTHPNFPYSESSVFSSTSQPSSRSALRSPARSSTR